MEHGNVVLILSVSGIIFGLVSTLWSLVLVWQENRLLGGTCLVGYFILGGLVPVSCALGMSHIDCMELTTEDVAPPAVMWLTGLGMVITSSVFAI